MSWPIGRGSAQVEFCASPTGELFANGVRLTDAEGWMVLRIRKARDLPAVEVRVRLRWDRTGTESPYLFVEDVVAEGRRYRSVYAMIVDGGEHVAIRLAECLHAEIEHRSRTMARRASGTRYRTSERPTLPAKPG
jgi:hypothetical protein